MEIAQLVERPNHDREVAGSYPMPVEFFLLYPWAGYLIPPASVDLAVIRYQQIFIRRNTAKYDLVKQQL